VANIPPALSQRRCSRAGPESRHGCHKTARVLIRRSFLKKQLRQSGYRGGRYVNLEDVPTFSTFLVGEQGLRSTPDDGCRTA
jgi:hypothetical protein